MGLLFLIMAGGIMGWLASIITQADYGRAVLRNGAIGVLGALLGGLVVPPMVGRSDLLSGSYDAGVLLMSIGGAAGLLLAVNLLRPDAVG
ncbi:MAG: GlsB/YeaQ/YmgE family stress response membrane protein [Porphyrobacter sp.]|nr:GlsB/YeaQ/YmgE family stress response membrane protein [Porphyrobacter sp.]